MKTISLAKKAVLIVAGSVFLVLHIALFLAGGEWRTAGVALLVVDVVTGMFLFGAIKEAKKLDANQDPPA